MTILIVDDYLTNLKLLKAQLEEEKYTVVSANNGIEALEILNCQAIDLIVSDILMPKMDGYRFCYEVRKSDAWRSLPFIFYTATYTSPGDEKLCYELGADAFIKKPASVEEIVQTIRTVVQQSQPMRMQAVPKVFNESDVLKEYSERLVTKLEHKNIELARRTEELHASEREIKAAHDQLKNIFDNLDEVFFSFDPVNNRLLQISPACQTVYGYPEDAFLKNPRLWFELIHPDDKARVQFENDRLIKGTPAHWECRIVRTNGEVRWIDMKGKPTVGASGAVVRIDGIITDITVRKSAEEYLRNREQQLTVVYQNVSDIIFYLEVESNNEFRFLSVNNAFLKATGLPEDHIVGKLVRQVIPEPSLGTALEKYNEAIREKRTVRWEETTAYPAGTKLGEVFVTPIFDASGRCTHLIGAVHDLTERKSLEEQLRRSQKLESIGTLTSGIAHDFNNILGIIMGHSTLLEKLHSDPEKRAKSIETIVKASQRGALLVKQLLTFARKTVPKFEPVRIDDIINQITMFLKDTFPKTVEITTNLEQDIPRTTVDATQIHQVFLNLCVNARDAMPAGGNLTMTTHTVEGIAVIRKFPKAKAGRYILIEVSDTGTGIDDATIQRMFEPFFTTKGVDKGTGLGLSVVFGIIENHSGFIDVMSAVGKGTTFNIYLPVREEGEINNGAPAYTVKDFAGGTETILVIEDEESLRELVKAILIAKGYTVITAMDGEEGVAHFLRSKTEIAAVISDMGLPKLSGQEVFKRIMEISPKAKVIFASGYIDLDIKTELLNAGLQHFIQKPYSPDEILHSVRTVIDSGK